MRTTLYTFGLAAAAGLTLAGCATTQAPQRDARAMTFFVTSVNPGKGADLGGLAGADQHCQTLAQAAGAGQRTWRAYLSTQAPALDNPGFVNARDRIGTGPWQNVNGVVIARTVDDLHGPASNLNKQTALNEKGGTAFAGAPFADMTCGNWTKGGKDGSAMTGHHDRAGPIGTATWATSWNSSHPTRGCDPDSLVSTGGAGLLYCFASN